MFREIFISPILFLESLACCFLLPKVTSIDPVYGSAASGAVLTGLAVTGILPEIESFVGLVMSLISMFVLFCIQTIAEGRNSKRTISLWSNCVGLSCYGLVSGFALSLTSGLEFVQYSTSIMISTLAISYSIGNRYIEYISNLKDRIPVLLFSVSAPLGLAVGRYTALSSFNTDILLGLTAGTFLMFGINNVLSANKSTNVYLENPPDSMKNPLICAAVLCGLTVSALLQSPVLSLVIDSNDVLLSNSTNSLLSNTTDILLSNSTSSLLSNTTDILLSNSTNSLLLNTTDISVSDSSEELMTESSYSHSNFYSE